MKKIIKLTEQDLHRIIKRVLTEQPQPPKDGGGDGYVGGRQGTSTASAGAYVTPGGIKWNTIDYPPPRKRGGYKDPYYPDDPYNGKRKREPTEGAYETKLRSTECCKKCKNGKFKHNCDDVQKGGVTKYSSTNCVYATLSDCQLNKRSKPGNIKGVKKKSK